MSGFLPVNAAEARARGWPRVDFVLVCGDAYVDHPSFGAALLGRVLEAAGYRVGLLPQPDVNDNRSFTAYGAPRLAFLVSGGVVDSMVAHYTAARRRRAFDEYSPGGKTGLRPDRVVDVYSRILRRLYPDVPLIVGGVEASLRRFAHYDYWEDEVRPSILVTSGADLVSYGMGERSLVEIAGRLAAGQPVSSLTDVPGTACLVEFARLPPGYVECASYQKVRQDKAAYARACRLQMDNQDPMSAKPLAQKQDDARYLVQNVPAKELSRAELDAVYALPFARRWHPMYDAAGGVPALEEVAFSIVHSRGCFGGCHFCAIAMHQGRRVSSRSEESVLAEAAALTKRPDFKGYIHDVGGPTANFRAPSCEKQAAQGLCPGPRRCLTPSPCPRLRVSHSEYLALLRKMRALPGVKKVFIRSGIRYDYLLHDKDESFFRELVAHHVSGQLKVAPEHCAPQVLRAMGKPAIETYNRFARRFYALTKQAAKQQYLVPYLMSGHPGATLKDAVQLAEYLHRHRMKPEQVQDFYPTPGTVSTCMYHTGLDPYTGQPVYVARTPGEKAMQRALLQPHLPQNRVLAARALQKAGREDLIPLLTGERARGEGERPPTPPTGRKKARRPQGGEERPAAAARGDKGKRRPQGTGAALRPAQARRKGK